MCHGLSQNTKKHHLNSYRNEILGKPYHEICDNIAVKMIYKPWAVYIADQLIFKNGKMDVPYTPVPIYLSMNQISFDGEIVQTFVEHCGISQVDIAREAVNKQITRIFHLLFPF